MEGRGTKKSIKSYCIQWQMLCMSRLMPTGIQKLTNSPKLLGLKKWLNKSKSTQTKLSLSPGKVYLRALEQFLYECHYLSYPVLL